MSDTWVLWVLTLLNTISIGIIIRKRSDPGGLPTSGLPPGSLVDASVKRRTQEECGFDPGKSALFFVSGTCPACDRVLHRWEKIRIWADRKNLTLRLVIDEITPQWEQLLAKNDSEVISGANISWLRKAFRVNGFPTYVVIEKGRVITSGIFSDDTDLEPELLRVSG